MSRHFLRVVPLHPAARSAVLCAALALVSGRAEAQPGYVSNLTGSLNTHDPVLIRQDSVYYLFHTGNGVPIKTSRDRIAWSNAGSVSSSAPSWHARFRNSNDSWAPAIAYWDSTYWLYHSISNFGSRRSAIGLRTNKTLHPDDPDYAWVDRGIVVCTYNNQATHPECFHASTDGVNSTDTTAFNAIDPDVVLDETGKPWLSWGSFGSGIQLIPLDRATGKPDSGAKPVTIAHRYTTSSPSGSGYERSIEAPVITRHNGWYYLWYSYDRCCAGVNSTYKVMVTRAEHVTGPYVDKAGNPAHPSYRANGATTGAWRISNAGTVVSQGDATHWYATGHNDIFVENDTVFLVNHGYIRAGGQANGGTRLMIRPLYWDSTGWPTLDSTQGTITWQGPPVSLSAGAPKAPVRSGRVGRLPAHALVPWDGRLRDLRGRTVAAPGAVPDASPAP